MSLREQESASEHPVVEFLCISCGYGVVIKGLPPACPMCRETAWEPVHWRPFSTRIDHALGGEAGPDARTA